MFTHLDENGRGQMVDISDKSKTIREAFARGYIKLKKETIEAIKNEKIKKGDVLAIAQVAAIQGVKNTPTIIPMTHSLLLNSVKVDFYFEDTFLYCDVRVKCEGKTGVEMEALTGVSCGLLTVYDMCKSMDKSMSIEKIYLVEKTGGKSGHFKHESLNEKIYEYGVIVASDTRASGENKDLVIDSFKEAMPDNYRLTYSKIVPDNIEDIKNELIYLADEKNMALIFTSGGTGFSKRDVTPEATEAVIERSASSISDAIRLYSKEKTNNWMLSRATSGIRKNSLIINLPGSPRAVKESIYAILPSLGHGLDILSGDIKQH
ncbi:MAG: bifunctional molybdenum cofactor biosynthesis protein MoaC/MoaB [Peptoniphilaceae bacterium]|nr:bifunctional molybdenum cofactor biosynthesis protein MoaC/MoaB [Peptoniphilaceae bacterium]MDY6018750.1 bifunctional molybdenum cofactor biosynthesis protein MoaC/MoaB [Anaerococcus sp.]